MRSLTNIVGCVAVVLISGARYVAAEPPSRFPALSDEQAWRQLPREAPPLPVWARILAPSLPRATAGMLKLDAVHRAHNPLGPELRGKLRLVAAQANRCDYSQRYATADLRRADLSDDELAKINDDFAQLPREEKVALNFARKLSLAAYSVTDEEFAELLALFGPEKTVAIVHTLAHANFQDRMFLALGVEVEAGGPLPPIEQDLDPASQPGEPAPERPVWSESQAASAKLAEFRPDWDERDLAALRQSLDQQQARPGRIPLPGPERLEQLPPDARARAERVVWTRVSLGYQPQMTQAWFDCMGAFRDEAKLDRVFSNTLFWVVTRSNECFY